MTADQPVRHRSVSAPAAALIVAIAYLLTWVVGLVIGAPELTPEQSGAAVNAAYAAAPLALLQAVLVHGLAGVLIGALALLYARRDGGLGRRGRRVTISAGLAAALLSFAQLAGEAGLVLGSPSADAARQLWDVVMVIDGVKMLALAVLVLATMPRMRRLPSRVLAVLTAVSLLVSGAGYLGLQAGLMMTAYVSLPLLLIWAVVSAVPGRRP